MKQIKGVVELHGDKIEIANHNNFQCAIIEGPSTYDMYCYLKEQNFELKYDLITELCGEMNEVQIKEITTKLLSIIK
jgi:hypothetical protein